MNAIAPPDLDFQRKREFAGLFEEAPIFMALLHGPGHEFEFINPGYRRLIGHRDVVGRRMAEVLQDVADQGYVAMLDEVYRTGIPITAASARYGMQVVPGGPVSERYIDFVLQPVRDAAGTISGIFILGTDVTDRVLIEIRRDALIRMTDVVRDPRANARRTAPRADSASGWPW